MSASQSARRRGGVSPWGEYLKDGSNYEVMSGQRLDTFVIVRDNEGYTVDRPIKDTDTGELRGLYVRCKFPHCKARGAIVDKFLKRTNAEPHTCRKEDGANRFQYMATDLVAKMRRQAAADTSCSIQVRIVQKHILFDIDSNVLVP